MLLNTRVVLLSHSKDLKIITPSFSSSSPSLQLSTSQLPPRPSSQLPSLPSEPYTQSDITSLLLRVEAGAAASLHVSAVSLATAFQVSQCYFVKCQSGQRKT